MSQQRNGEITVVELGSANAALTIPPPQHDLITNGVVAGSQEVDFQETARLNVPQRTGPGRQDIPDPAPKNDETEESTCSICYESWTNSGSHRLVAIKCGHLFGESCIIKWIQQQAAKSSRAKCPSCNLPARRSDIRRLWSKNVTVLDTAERDEAIARAKKEAELRSANEQELVKSRLANEMLKNQLSLLQNRCDRETALKRKYKATIKRMRLSDPVMDAISRRTSYVYKPAHIVRFIQRPDGYQYMSYRSSEEMLVCSRRLENGSYGLFKISMRDYSTSMYSPIAIHSQPIKDVQCYNAGKGLPVHGNRSLVLTASLDKSLKLTSMASDCVVMTYNMQAAGWSCCWSNTNPYTMYAATKSRETAIMVYDIRSTNGHIAKYSHPGLLGASPIHSLCHIGNLGGQDGRAGLLCGNLEGVVVLDLDQLDRLNSEEGGGSASASYSTAMTSVPSSQPLSSSQSLSSSQLLSQDLVSRTDRSRGPPSLYRLKESSCWSVSYDHDSEQWLGSFRFKDSQRPTEHVLGSIVANDTFDNPEEAGCLWRLEPNTSFKGGQPPRGFGRSCITTRRDGSTHAITGSSNEIVVFTETQEPTIMTSSSSRDGNLAPQAYTNRVVLGLKESGQTITHSRQQGSSRPNSAIAADSELFIKDVKSVNVGETEYLCSLSDKEVRLFCWSSQSPMDDDDDDDDEEEDEEDEGESMEDQQTRETQRRRITEEDGGPSKPILLDVSTAGGRQEGQQHGREQQQQQQHEVISIDGDSSSSDNDESSTQLSDYGPRALQVLYSRLDDYYNYDDNDDYDIDTWHDMVWAEMEQDAAYGFYQ